VLSAQELVIWNREIKRIVESVVFEKMAGENSMNLQKIELEVTQL
jgi:hypothetical protein|tara:strand:- start:5216 stop:5350 length:135 start_codon:yes stop_codon:yes gene_type:complete